MLGQVLELGRPPGVDRPEGFKVAAQPFQIILPLLPLVDFDAVVDRHEAGAARGRFLDGIVDRRAAMVEEDDNGVGVPEVFRPLVLGVNDGVRIRIMGIERTREIDGCGEKFMIPPRPMGRRIGDEDDLFDTSGSFLRRIVENVAVFPVVAGGAAGRSH